MIDRPDYSEIINAFEPVWIGIPDYATGDQFTLAAMLLHRPSTHVLVTGYSGPWNSCQMLQTFEQTLNIRGQASDGSWSLGDPNNPRVVFKPSNESFQTSQPIKIPSYATQTVGQNYNSEWKTNLRTAWELPAAVHGQNTAVPNALSSWITKINPKLGELLLNLHKHNIIVLWLRHSGAMGGAHLEHDTGTTATLTLIEMLLLKDPSNLIILAGDRKNKQISKIITSPWAERIFDFTEFWKNKDADPTGWGGRTRMGQLRFYDCLNAAAHSLRHIGSRSGNLELMALIGHNVDYIEEENSFGGERMVPFNRSTELHYKRIITSRPLTFKGTLTRIVNYLLSRNEELWQLFTHSFDFIGKDDVMEIGKTMSVIAASPSNRFFENKTLANIPKPFQEQINCFYDLLLKRVLNFFTQKEQLDVIGFFDEPNLLSELLLLDQFGVLDTDDPPQYLALNQYAVTPCQMNILYPLIAKLSKTLNPHAPNALGLSPDTRRHYSGFAPGDINALL